MTEALFDVDAKGQILATVDADRIHADDSARIKAVILADGREHGGRIDQNRVRRALTNNGGHLDVYPRCVGPAYHALYRSGLIEPLGYVDINADVTGRNNGKPQMGYRLTEAGWAA